MKKPVPLPPIDSWNRPAGVAKRADVGAEHAHHRRLRDHRDLLLRACRCGDRRAKRRHAIPIAQAIPHAAPHHRIS